MPRVVIVPLLLAACLGGSAAQSQGEVRAMIPSTPVIDSAHSLVTELTAGRLVVHGLSFDAGGATIDPSSIRTLRALAVALRRTTGTYLIESHTLPGRGAQALSDRRAAAVRTWLLASGVDPSRLYAAGFGATRPRPPPLKGGRRGSPDRIEISRIR